MESAMNLKLAVSAVDAVVMGTGLIALDVVIQDESTINAQLWAGGTCGNVLTILSFLGWHSIPVSRLSSDTPSRVVEGDLRRWSVDVTYLRMQPSAETPVVIQTLARESHGSAGHRFSMECPLCGSWLPRFQPITIPVAKQILSNSPLPTTFFVDRVSPAILLLAKSFAERGALIVFEPSSTGNVQAFQEMVRIAHVVKYSRERRKGLVANFLPNERPLLEVETLGADGLRYCIRPDRSTHGAWRCFKPFKVEHVIDSAGSGDWCTAGFIHLVGRQGIDGFNRMREVDVEQSLLVGQALAAWNCGYQGARGGMYGCDRQQVWQEVHEILGGAASISPAAGTADNFEAMQRLGQWCAQCSNN